MRSLFGLVVIGLVLVCSRAVLHAATITGTVEDTLGNPVAGAVVDAHDPAFNGNNATTDIGGAYTISGLSAGTYSVSVDVIHLGYQNPPPQINLALLSSQTKTVNFTVAAVVPTATIQGRVTSSSTGAGLAVQVEAYNLGTGYNPVTTSDSSGNYSFALPAGDWEVSVSATGLSALGYRPVSEQILALAAGQTLRADFSADPVVSSSAADECAVARTVGPLPYTDSLDTTGATSSADPHPNCWGGTNNTVWYSFTPTASGNVTVDTFGSDYDTTLVVFVGTCGSSLQAGCSDDFNGIQSLVEFAAIAGTTYTIMVGSYDPGGGSLVLNVTGDLGIPGEECVDAWPAVGIPFRDSQDTTAATSVTDPLPGCWGASNNTVWYSFTAATSEELVIDTLGSDYDTTLAVFTGGCGSLVEEVCNDDWTPEILQSSLTLNATAGTTYTIMVGSYFAAGGNLELHIGPPQAEHWADPLSSIYIAYYYGELTLDGLAAEPGDELVAFDPDGVLCGRFVVESTTETGTYGYMMVYGDDPLTPEDEGATDGDPLTFFIWDASQQAELRVKPTLVNGSLLWSDAQVSQVNLAAVSSVIFTQPLQAGWNLVSIPIGRVWHVGAEPTVPMAPWLEYLPVASIGDVLSSIAGKYTYVSSFDAAGAHTYNPALPAFLNSLKYLAGGYAYKIKTTEACDLLISGPPLVMTDGLPLSAGWNLIGYWGDDVQYVSSEPTYAYPNGAVYTPVSAIADVLAPIAGKYSYMSSYDASGAHTYNPALPAFLNSLKYMGPGYGYWLNMSEAGTLHFAK